MADKTRGSKSEGSATPKEFAQTTPNFNQSSHDFTLQIVVDMQKTLGELKGEMNAKMERVISDVSALDTKVSNISHRVSWFAGGAAFVGALGAGALLVLNLIAALGKVSPAPVAAPAVQSQPVAPTAGSPPPS